MLPAELKQQKLRITVFVWRSPMTGHVALVIQPPESLSGLAFTSHGQK